MRDRQRRRREDGLDLLGQKGIEAIMFRTLSDPPSWESSLPPDAHGPGAGRYHGDRRERGLSDGLRAAGQGGGQAGASSPPSHASSPAMAPTAKSGVQMSHKP
jgi:hypothetical protein